MNKLSSIAMRSKSVARRFAQGRIWNYSFIFNPLIVLVGTSYCSQSSFLNSVKFVKRVFLRGALLLLSLETIRR